VGCTAGALFDVVVDLRPESPTFCRWFGTALSRGNRKMIYVPEGCAHGYQTLEDDTDVFYQISEFYSPEQASGVRWDDPAFGIDWPGDVDPLISDKDKAWPLFIKPGPFKTKEATYAAVS
jgi:dTDP-4-dehydrorhamnose 3,5-epimerase